ncbi:PREDICTED: probable protein phosphatase 2C 27 isoform X2 [Ipomoea nil]|uniref:probable protein phosphatase 2C 27 isoform X2 n=1 Tax=Ipomoea nil TaxID=35883 RepID=UPI000901430C|nr:PREDICTED: probable protein phosphatase 2C 27 isoform X2 [Ipomoea nil]
MMQTSTDFGVDIKEIEGKPSFLPVFRSRSCVEMGPKQYMEDEHIRIDNVGEYLGESASFGVLQDLSMGVKWCYLRFQRALGDWHMNAPKGSACPLSAEPEMQEIILTDDDEFLIMGCDGLWDVMSSQCAVTMARKELMMHNDPERCSRELVREALKRNTCDNLTVIVVCFSPILRLR